MIESQEDGVLELSAPKLAAMRERALRGLTSAEEGVKVFETEALAAGASAVATTGALCCDWFVTTGTLCCDWFITTGSLCCDWLDTVLLFVVGALLVLVGGTRFEVITDDLSVF